VTNSVAKKKKNNLSDLIGVEQAAKLLHVGARQVRKMIASGLLPAQVFGGSYIIKRSDLAKVPKVRKPGPKPKAG